MRLKRRITFLGCLPSIRSPSINPDPGFGNAQTLVSIGTLGPDRDAIARGIENDDFDFTCKREVIPGLVDGLAKGLAKGFGIGPEVSRERVVCCASNRKEEGLTVSYGKQSEIPVR